MYLAPPAWPVGDEAPNLAAFLIAFLVRYVRWRIGVTVRSRGVGVMGWGRCWFAALRERTGTEDRDSKRGRVGGVLDQFLVEMRVSRRQVGMESGVSGIVEEVGVGKAAPDSSVTMSSSLGLREEVSPPSFGVAGGDSIKVGLGKGVGVDGRASIDQSETSEKKLSALSKSIIISSSLAATGAAARSKC